MGPRGRLSDALGMTAIAYELRRRRPFPLPRRRTVGRTVALGATAVFLFLFVHSGALGDAHTAMRGLSSWTLAVSVAAILGGMGFTALRWRTLLRATGVEAPLPRLFSALAVSAAANNVLPARGGDVVRVAALRTAVPVPASAVVGTMLAERLLDGFTLALWILLGALIAGAGAPLLPIGLALCAGTGTGIALAALAAAAPERSARILARVTRILPQRARRPVESAVAGALGGLSVFRSRRLLASALASSLALWACDVVMYGALAHGFGLDIGLGGWLLLEGVGNLALAVPASAAGIGSFDYLTLLGARSLGVSAGAAGAYVLTVHALVVLPATLLGGLLARSAFRTPRTRERSRRRTRRPTSSAALPCGDVAVGA